MFKQPERRDPKKRAARWAVREAIRKGLLIRGPCSICGAEKAHGHHPDYEFPLAVVWLCASCHRKVHAKTPEILCSKCHDEPKTSYHKWGLACLRDYQRGAKTRQAHHNAITGAVRFRKIMVKELENAGEVMAAQLLAKWDFRDIFVNPE